MENISRIHDFTEKHEAAQINTHVEIYQKAENESCHIYKLCSRAA